MHERDLIRQVAELHRYGLDQGFLSSLGPRFLRLLYTAIDEDPESVLFVEMDGARVVGFITSGSGMGSIYRRLLHHPFRLAIALAPALLSPARLKGVLEVLRASGREEGDSSDRVPPLPRHELFSIVVAPDHRGRGVADRLYRQLCERLAKKGAASFRILVGKQLYAANRFYRRMGARPVTEVQLHEGAVSTIYVQYLGGEAGPPPRNNTPRPNTIVRE